MKHIISLLILVSFISCNNDDDDSLQHLHQTEEDIIEYIAANDLDAEKTELGVYYVVEELGNGISIDAEAYVKIIFEGFFLDGTKFSLSETEGSNIDLLAVIPGFADGITQFNNEGKGTLLIPPHLAYGDSGNYNQIPGGAVLVFEIEIVEVMNPQSEADIIAYLEENQIEAERTESGLHYVIENQGDGDEITENSIVEIDYKGYYLNGVTFDSSDDVKVPIDLRNVIPGFAEGISLFNVGGSGTIYLPPHLAYGEDGVPNKIPRSAVLIFDIKL